MYYHPNYRYFLLFYLLCHDHCTIIIGMNIPDSRCSKSQLNQVAQADKVAVHNAG